MGLAALLVLGLALRVLMAWRFRVDSDEPQHLHVVWAWTHGLLPYRDVFDNHMPLFHLLSGILVAGARFDAVRGGFEVGIPALYVIVDRSGSARGLLDGRPYGSPRRLRTGFHSYRPAPGESPAAALWSNAAERGFSPFDAEGNWQ